MLANSRTISAKIRANEADHLERHQQRRQPPGAGIEVGEELLAAQPHAVDDHHPQRDQGQRGGDPEVRRSPRRRCARREIRDRADRQQAQQVHRQDEEEDRPDELDEAVGVGAAGRAARPPCGGTRRSPRWRCRRRSAPASRPRPSPAAGAPRPAPAGSAAAAASIIITIWLSSRVILPPWVSHPRSAGRWIIGCRTMCSSGFSARHAYSEHREVLRTFLKALRSRGPRTGRRPPAAPTYPSAIQISSGRASRTSPESPTDAARTTSTRSRSRHRHQRRGSGEPGPPRRARTIGSRPHRRGDHPDARIPRSSREAPPLLPTAASARTPAGSDADRDRDRPGQEPPVLRGWRPEAVIALRRRSFS